MRGILIAWFMVVDLLAVAAVVGLAMSTTVQVVTPFDPIKQELTGEYGLADSEPTEVLLVDRSALVEGRRSESGLPLFDRNIAYPIQMRTYWFFFWRAGIGLLALMIVMTLVWRVRRRSGQAMASRLPEGP